MVGVFVFASGSFSGAQVGEVGVPEESDNQFENESCIIESDTLLCTGDVSGCVRIDADTDVDYNKLIVRDLTKSIVRNQGNDGARERANSGIYFEDKDGKDIEIEANLRSN